MKRLANLLIGSGLLLANSVHVNVMTRNLDSLINTYKNCIKNFGDYNGIAEQMNQITDLLLASGYGFAAFALPVVVTYLCAKSFKEAISPTQE